MAKQTIDLGTLGGADGTGDSIRTAGAKINSNFTELYATSAVQSHIGIVQNEISSTLSNADIDLKPSGTGSISFPAIRFNGNNIETTRTNDDLKITPSGTGYVTIDGLGFSGTSIHAVDSSTVNINEALNVNGTLNAGATTFDSDVTLNSTLDDTGNTTLSSLAVSSTTSFADSVTIDNLTINDNVISSSSNAGINLSPGGSGGVYIYNQVTIDSSFVITDNTIKAIRSDDNIELLASGSGTIKVTNIDMNDGTIDNTVIGATTPAAGTFTTLTFNPVDGGTLNTTGITITGNEITTTQSNDNLEIDANSSGYVEINGLLLPHVDGATGQVLRTDGSGQLDWFTSPTLLGVSDIQDNQTTISFAGQTVIDHVTAVGDHHRVESGISVLDSFVTSKYDSAWYLAVNRDDTSTEFEVVKHSLCHGVTSDGSTTDAFVSSSASAQTGTNNHIITSADRTDGLVRLLGTGSSTFNSMAYYRIGLGDDDSTGYSGEEESAIRINADVDTGPEVIDSWTHASFRGAKYYISVKNTDSGETSNIEAVVVHNGVNAFISVYNIIHSGAAQLLPTITATINGANVEVSATGANNNNRVHMYRILLSDNEVDRNSTNINVIGNVTVSSATTTIDTFDTGAYQAAHYVIVSHNASEGHSSICEAAVVSDGTNAFVTQYGLTSTKGTDQIILTVGHAGTTTTLSATSTSGGSTVVNAYRVNLTRGPGTSTATATLDSVDASVYRGAKYNVQVVDAVGLNYECFEVNVVHDGSVAYTSTFGNVGNNIDLITVSADINAGNLRLRGTINNTNEHTVTVVRRVIQA